MIIRCRHRIPSPEAVGFLTVEGLREAAAQYPHLRPCKKHSWNWLYRKAWRMKTCELFIKTMKTVCPQPGLPSRERCEYGRLFQGLAQD